jgi:hypothetical protein
MAMEFRSRIPNHQGEHTELLKGFEKGKNDSTGIYLYKVKGWDYSAMLKTFAEGIERARTEHVPVVFHVTEITQPQGHSTSGSHERYKSPERMKWEAEFDCNKRFHDWILQENIATEQELVETEQRAINDAKIARDKAWDAYTSPIKKERDELIRIIDNRSCMCKREHIDKVGIIPISLRQFKTYPKDNLSSAKKILRPVCTDVQCARNFSRLSVWLDRIRRMDTKGIAPIILRNQ